MYLSVSSSVSVYRLRRDLKMVSEVGMKHMSYYVMMETYDYMNARDITEDDACFSSALSLFSWLVS